MMLRGAFSGSQAAMVASLCSAGWRIHWPPVASEAVRADEYRTVVLS